MNASVAQDNENDFRNTNLLLNKNNISFVIPFNCPLNMGFMGRLVPGRLVWTAIAKNTHTGQTKVMFLDFGISICYYSIFSCRDINIQITLTERKFISNDRKARKIGE